VHATNATKITTSFFIIAIFHFLFLSHKYLVESLKTWFSSHCGVSCFFLWKQFFLFVFKMENLALAALKNDNINPSEITLPYPHVYLI